MITILNLSLWIGYEYNAIKHISLIDFGLMINFKNIKKNTLVHILVNDEAKEFRVKKINFT